MTYMARTPENSREQNVIRGCKQFINGFITECEISIVDCLIQSRLQLAVCRIVGHMQSVVALSQLLPGNHYMLVIYYYIYCQICHSCWMIRRKSVPSSFH